ncbi:unnamed protein product, partial [Sphacelaria rigidula]
YKGAQYRRSHTLRARRVIENQRRRTLTEFARRSKSMTTQHVSLMGIPYRPQHPQPTDPMQVTDAHDAPTPTPSSNKRKSCYSSSPSNTHPSHQPPAEHLHQGIASTSAACSRLSAQFASQNLNGAAGVPGGATTHQLQQQKLSKKQAAVTSCIDP